MEMEFLNQVDLHLSSNMILIVFLRFRLYADDGDFEDEGLMFDYSRLLILI